MLVNFFTLLLIFDDPKASKPLWEHAFSKNHNALGTYINNNYKNFIKNLY